MKDELVLITTPNFALDHLSRTQLLTSILLMREQGSGSRRVVETALEKAGLKLKCFRRVMDLDSTEAIKFAVEAGLGLGFVSRWAVSKETGVRVIENRARTRRPHYPAFYADYADWPGTAWPGQRPPYLYASPRSVARGRTSQAGAQRHFRAIRVTNHQ
jgi:DNA-binding transcriptional LysR family regulator